MKFRTEIIIEKAAFDLNLNNKILFLGSCFTENIGNKLKINWFETQINPFGIIYNPFSVKKSLDLLIENKPFEISDLINQNGLWHSFSHHSRFSGIDANEVLENINETLHSSAIFLQKADYLFITFGTAWVYFWQQTGSVVSNCHKLDPKHFKREILDVETITSELSQTFDFLHQFNHSLKIIFTVSPVRHWKDGANGNQLSKATLFLAIEQLKKKYPFIFYFPAYEILMDDLRDYRFYADDLLHPNPLAINYIYEKFSQHYFNAQTQNLLKQIESIERAKAHKPFNLETEEYEAFRLQLQYKEENLKVLIKKGK